MARPTEIKSAFFELDDMGILRTTKMPPRYAWLSDLHKELLIQVLHCGKEGLTRSRTKKMSAERQEALHMLELRDYLLWERDRFGKLTFLCLTWKGEEAAQTALTVAQNQAVASGAAQLPPS